ncbi:hypothetical protein HBI04_139580 [Parastagonospora nodorum]|nr:hypothetical protein HBI03_154900 [Parastagonospora nodorum]KAH4272835.1 hypothetical protein HBI04_139580 [Parastagonospora nodorum]KAH4984309.1 hypothetical protein HBI76_142800 [Parastagonospora nodorum]KAH5780178.1 hypothetical protein HBI16_053450 [Parastagonospora nodorum]
MMPMKPSSMRPPMRGSHGRSAPGRSLTLSEAPFRLTPQITHACYSTLLSPVLLEYFALTDQLHVSLVTQVLSPAISHAAAP